MAIKVSVEGDWGVIDGLPRPLRRSLRDKLNTQVELRGDRLAFKPGRDVLTYLAHQPDFQFDSRCRTAWGHFFKKKASIVDAVAFHMKTEPYKHQNEIFHRAKDLEFFALEWEMGLGKAKTGCDIAGYKFLKGEIDAVLVITQKGIHENWVDNEVPAHLPVADDKYMARAWKSGKKDHGMAGLLEFNGLSIATINFDVIHRKDGEAFIKRFLAERRVMLIIDEFHYIKTPGAKRTKAALKIAKHSVCRLIMTGTPVPNSPEDVWAPYQFLSDQVFPFDKFWQHRQRYCVMRELPGKTDRRGQPIRIVVGGKNLDELKRLLDPHRSRLLKENCLDLPEKVYRQVKFEMTEEQRRAYKKMTEELLLELESGERVTAQLQMIMRIRLDQIACGFVKPDDGPEQPINKTNPRLEALMNELEQVHNKAIIWAWYKYNHAEIEDALKTAYGEASVVTYTGATPQDMRRLNINKFQNESKVIWMLANPQSAGTGNTMTAAQDTFYFNNQPNLVLRLQSEDRTHRIGQVGTCTYTDFIAKGTHDARKLRDLQNKLDTASLITGDALKDWLRSVE